MKNAFIFHGTSCNPEKYWFPYLKRELEQREYVVSIPQLPEADTPDVNKWLPVALAQGKYNSETIIIGHSAGGPLVLSVLEHIHTPIAKAIIVSGYARTKGDKKPEKILQASYDWEKIKNNAKEIYCINSDNDPWGCNDVEGRYIYDHVGGTLIIRHGEGHMGSDSFNQPYKQFPLLVKLIEL